MKTIYEQRCRICGCDWNHACNDHDYWFAENLCSACAERMKSILFNTEMVRAILDGRKTTTRRTIKLKYDNTHIKWRADKYGTQLVEMQNDVEGETYGDNPDGSHWHKLLAYRPINPLYKKGDILYVRETFAIGEIAYGEEPDGTAVPFISQCIGENGIIPKEYALRHGIGIEDVVWKPSLHMQKEAARIFLRVTDVRAERLQDITSTGALAEGVGDLFVEDCAYDDKYKNIPWVQKEGLSVHQFARLWDSTVKPAGRDKYGWTANPWVWVITFERIGKLEENADA